MLVLLDNQEVWESGYLILEILNNKLQKASFEKINLDFRNSINLIQKTKLSQETKKKLIGYLEL